MHSFLRSADDYSAFTCPWHLILSCYLCGLVTFIFQTIHRFIRFDSFITFFWAYRSVPAALGSLLILLHIDSKHYLSLDGCISWLKYWPTYSYFDKGCQVVGIIACPFPDNLSRNSSILSGFTYEMPSSESIQTIIKFSEAVLVQKSKT